MKIRELTITAALGLSVMCSAPRAQTPRGEDFLTRAIDRSVNPGDDFFRYATGTWMKNNPIPPEESAWTVGDMVQEETYSRLKSILDEAVRSSSPKGSNKQKIGDFYASGMDTITIEKLGINPLSEELELIASVNNKKDLCQAVTALQREGVYTMYSPFVDQDAKKSDQYALMLWQGGIGLPNREYYFRKDARTEKIRAEYKKYIKNMLALLGQDEKSAAADAASVYGIELYLAEASKKLEELRDPYANYNKMSLKQLSKTAPSLAWGEMFSKAGISGIDSMIVGQPEFFRQLDRAVKKFSIGQWKAYLRFHLVSSFAPTLSKRFEEENFHFTGTVLSGVEVQRPRWKRIQDEVESQLGELLGQVYVEKYYSPETKKRYEKLVGDIIDAFGERIKSLSWMSESTKAKALSKLKTVNRKVGYPDVWKDFSNLTIERDSFVRNLINANIFWFDYMVNKLGRPVDRQEWSMTPQTYNAYYNPSNNEIVLPAAMFIVPGVPDSLLDDAVIYSYAGASTIGHEITHGFDDEGRQYDAKGNLSQWWTKEDEKKFNERAKVMIEQFNSYVVLDSMHINGEATLGENIADLGGLVIGLDAFKKTEQYKNGTVINGLTPLQRFWLGYAYSWLGHQRAERLARQVMTDVHSPAFLRVNGPLSNIPEFYEAFGVKPGGKMYRSDEKRVKIW